MRHVLALVLGAAALLSVSGCGDSEDRSGQGAGTTTTAPTTTTTETSGIDPLEGASTETIESEASGEGIALMERVAIGQIGRAHV